MFSRFATVLTSALLLLLPASQWAAEPSNLTTAKQAVMQYASSGEYGRDVAAVALKANRYITDRSARAKPTEKLAVVFDIDETVITNLSQMTAADFGYVPAVWKKWVMDGRAPAIVPVQVVYDNAVKRGVKVFFITARTESDRAGTLKNLREVGYETYEKIYFMPEEPMPTRLFKTNMRRQIESEGYTIIANIGDQQNDLAGGHAERTYKLPNPFYLTN